MLDGRQNNKGTKGNKGGRKSKADEMRIRDLTSPYVVGAIDKVVKIMNNAEKESDQLAAAKLLLAYHFGQPSQSIDHTTGGDKLNIPVSKWV